jgi:putative endonuclease
MNNKRQCGAEYEKMAGEYLEKQGYEILFYNYRCFFGEIDIIAKEGKTIVFCEVKYRSSVAYGNPLESVNTKKQKIIFKSAMYYLRNEHSEEVECRFDVIGFMGNEITHIKNAFQG